MKNTAKYSTVAVLISFLIGCIQPLVNVRDQPINASYISLDEISNTIVAAGNNRGWNLRPIKPGVVAGYITAGEDGRHRADIEITFDTTTYSILYKDSVDMRYNGQHIHHRYNRWIELLDKDLRNKLS